MSLLLCGPGIDPRHRHVHRRSLGSWAGLSRIGSRGLAFALALALSSTGCSKDVEVRAVELQREAESLLVDQKWEAAEKKAQEILALSGLSPISSGQAKKKLERAQSEQQTKLLYQRFVGTKDADPDSAVLAYLDMPEDSYYRGQVQSDFEKLKTNFITDHLEKAESARDNGRCADFKAQIEQILSADPKNQKTLDLAKKPCPAK